MKKTLLIFSLCSLTLLSCIQKNKPETQTLEKRELETRATGSIVTYTVFDKERVAFEGNKEAGLLQYAIKEINLPKNFDNFEKIEMSISLDCPEPKCGDWDVFAHAQVWSHEANDWIELGRYITPYGVDSRKKQAGFNFDVTDIRSLLKGKAKIRIFTEVWTNDGWLISLKFHYMPGKSKYKYSTVTPILAYNKSSLDGIPYGEEDQEIMSKFPTKKKITFPEEIENAQIRTIISGWGHASPGNDGRGCAEWCFRTHHIDINGKETFKHKLEPLGCDTNPIQPQNGNWYANRAGWCPGMEVPTRIDVFTENMSNKTVSYDYIFEKWKKNYNDNQKAYYAISSYLILESNSPIKAVKISCNQ